MSKTQHMYTNTVMKYQLHQVKGKRYSSPITGLDRLSGFQEV